MPRTEHPNRNDNQSPQNLQDRGKQTIRAGMPPEHEPHYNDEDLQPADGYDSMSDEQLAQRAEELEIEGRGTMLNDQLIEAIRRKEEPDRVDATRAADQSDPNAQAKRRQR